MLLSISPDLPSLGLRGPFDRAHAGGECVLVAVDRAPLCGFGALAPLTRASPSAACQAAETASWLAALAPQALMVALPLSGKSTWLSLVLEHLHARVPMALHRLARVPLERAWYLEERPHPTRAESSSLLQRIQQLNRPVSAAPAIETDVGELERALARVAAPHARTLVLGEWAQVQTLRSRYESAGGAGRAQTGACEPARTGIK